MRNFQVVLCDEWEQAVWAFNKFYQLLQEHLEWMIHRVYESSYALEYKDDDYSLTVIFTSYKLDWELKRIDPDYVWIDDFFDSWEEVLDAYYGGSA